MTGSLTSLPNLDYQIEVFANFACDENDFGEGERFLGAFEVTTDVAGIATFDVNLPRPIGDGASITATATAPDGSTSEFSECFAAFGPATTTSTTTSTVTTTIFGTSTSTTTLQGGGSTTTLPGGGTTTTTQPGGGTTTTTTPGSGSTTTTLPIPCSADSQCDDGDACTTGTCVAGFCDFEHLTSIPGVVCHVDNLRVMFDNLVCSGCSCKFVKKLDKIERRYMKAESTDRFRRCKRSLKGGRRISRKFARKVTKRTRKGCISPAEMSLAVTDESAELATAAEVLSVDQTCPR